MKTLNLSRWKRTIAATIFVAVLALATPGRAGLQVPYTPDADTLHLWHFDGLTNTLSSTDEVLTASITFTNYAQSQSPGTKVTLGSASAIAQLGACLQIIPTNLTAGNAFAFAVNGTFWPDTTPFRNASSGAFTMEAIVRCTGDPYKAGNGNWEIIAGDNSPGAGQSRGWQFRIQSGAQPQLDFNFITGGGGNFLANLPKTGPNILLQGVWYHVAVTYTGNTPTNTDTAGILTFYWTVLDGGRTAASMLTNYPTAGTFTLGGTPVLGIGGSARNLAGTVANGEGFKGLIDEVRISDICRASNQMAFAVGGAATPPVFLQQPPTNTFIGFGQPLSLPALVAGAPTYYWFHAGTNLPGQIDSSLFVPSATFAESGTYQLVASNSLGSVTSVVAQVTIGAPFGELFNTGISAGTIAAPNATEEHYTLTSSSDFNHLGPDTIVWDMNAYPIAANGGNFSNPDGVSTWIGPQPNAYTSPEGNYTYRTTFLLDGVDTTKALTLSGIWYVNEFGSDIRLNGQSTGNANSAANSNAGKNPANFVITNGFVPGLNTLEFVTTRSAAANGSYQESALRVEMSGLGQALPPGLPSITSQPVDQTVRDGAVFPGSVATFSAVALGRPPLSYQWWADGAPVTDATNRALQFISPATGLQGTNFHVVISNDSGSVTSSVAVLTLLATNQPPVAPGFAYTIYANNTLSIDASALYRGASDADHDPLTITVDTVSTNLGTITMNGVLAVYTPPLDYSGADEFNYNISDPGSTTLGPINVTILPLLSPTVSSYSIAGTNLVLTGQGGAAGGGFHVLSSTNLATPLTNWVVGPAGVFDGSGNFSVTNAILPGVPRNFYVIQVP